MTPQQKERHEYLYDILAKMENNFESNFYEIFGLLKAYIKAEIEMIKAQEKENPISETEKKLIERGFKITKITPEDYLRDN